MRTVEGTGDRHDTETETMRSNGSDDEGGRWLDRLADAEFAEGDERLDAGILEPPINGNDVPELCRLLGTDDRPKVRRRAAQALGRVASTEGYDPARVHDGLTRAILSDDSAAVRAAAIGALYRHDATEVDRLSERMVTAIERGDSEIETVRYFRNRLTDDRPEFRLLAAAAMETIGEPRLCQTLEVGFADPDQRVRVRAIEAYGRIGNALDTAVNVDPLEQLLADENPSVRRAAATALSEIGTEDSLEALLIAIESTDERLRQISTGALHRLDRRRTVTALTEALQDRSTVVRRRAIVSLIKLYREGSTVRPSDVRDRLLEETARSELIELAELLLATVRGESGSGGGRSDVEREAVWLLGEAADIEAAAASAGEDLRCLLVDALKQPEETIGEIAAAYLRRYDGENVETKLRAVSNDSDVAPEARARAESVLDTIKQSVASELQEHAIEYTYLKRPSEYTDKHGR